VEKETGGGEKPTDKKATRNRVFSGTKKQSQNAKNVRIRKTNQRKGIWEPKGSKETWRSK